MLILCNIGRSEPSNDRSPYTSHTTQSETQIVYGPGWYKPEMWDNSWDSWYWSKSPSTLWIHSPVMRKAQLETVLSTVHSPDSVDMLGDTGDFVITINENDPQHIVGNTGHPLIVDIELHPGWNQIVLELDAGNFRPIDTVQGNEDARQLSFALKEFSLSFE